jgi:hypothetical protein
MNLFKRLDIIVKKVKTASSWFTTLVKLFTGRGKKTYGIEQLITFSDQLNVYSRTNYRDEISASNLIKKYMPLFKVNSCKLLKRIGPKKDSGYVLCDYVKNPKIISGGAGKNIEFELHFAKRGSQVLIYDPTVKILPSLHSNIVHKSKYLYGDKTESKNSDKLSSAISNIQKASEYPGQPIFLKLDIEGSEWELLMSEIHLLKSFTQIIIEFHGMYKLLDQKFRKNADKIFANLFKHHATINFHSNNNDKIINIGEYFIPNTFELTLLRKDILRQNTSNTKQSYKKNLNRKNNMSKLDIPHEIFRFKNE